jgi:hypothetical protein
MPASAIQRSPSIVTSRATWLPHASSPRTAASTPLSTTSTTKPVERSSSASAPFIS